MSSTSEIISIPNISKLQWYDLESTIPSSEGSDDGAYWLEERIGDTDWYVCGEKSHQMETYTKSLYWRETNEVPDEYFHGENFKSSSFLQ